MSYIALAEQTGISLPGVHKVVARLGENGIISYRGSGKRQLIALRKHYPLYPAIVELFKSENERYDNLIKAIKKEMAHFTGHLKSAWIYGKTAKGTDQYGDPVQIALLGNSDTIDRITDDFKAKIRDKNIEADFDVSLEMTGLTMADIEASTKTLTSGYRVLTGLDPIFFAANQPALRERNLKHQDLDKQSLEAGKAWGVLLKQHPEIIARTLNHLEERIAESDRGTAKELQDWKHLLESMSLQRLLKFLESDTDRSARLRQSNPIWMVLTNEERERLLQLITKHHNHES